MYEYQILAMNERPKIFQDTLGSRDVYFSHPAAKTPYLELSNTSAPETMLALCDTLDMIYKDASE